MPCPWISADAVASGHAKHRDWVLGIIAKSIGAEARPTAELSVAEWVG